MTEPLLPPVSSSEPSASPEHLHLLRTLKQQAHLLRLRCQHAQALDLLQRALPLSARLLGAEHPDTICLLSDLALERQHLGQFLFALSLHHRVLLLYERLLGPDHPNTATT